jgi:hypothetical protein
MSSERKKPTLQPALETWRGGRRRLWIAAVLACVAALGVTGFADPDEDPRRPLRPERRPAAAPMELTDEQVELVLDFLSAWRPSAVERLEQLKASDPEAYREAVARMAASDRIRHMLAMQRHDPEGFAARAQEFRAIARAERLGRELRDAGGGTEDLQRQVRDAASEVVDARLKVREHDLARLQKQLEDLRAELEDQRQNRRQLIDRYYQRLLKPRDLSDFERGRPGPDDDRPPRPPAR